MEIKYSNPGHATWDGVLDLLLPSLENYRHHEFRKSFSLFALKLTFRYIFKNF